MEGKLPFGFLSGGSSQYFTAAGSTTELSTIAHRMRESSQMSSDALGNLKASSEDMSFKIDDISSAISETQGAVATINEKVEQIASIASQTNLLSLNASIEAARAGEAGKGFAVVAEEIGKLADSSRQMANDIRVEMDNLLSKSDAAVSAAGEVKEGNEEQNEALDKTLASISDMLQDIGKTVDGISAISYYKKTLREDAQTAEMALIAAQYRGRARVLQEKLDVRE